tara:strand:+ start:558 stop:995 length:438 start_codon:yes stop_codon:yes gene_type:complete
MSIARTNKSKLTYGGGLVSVSGVGIAGIEIHYKGRIEYNSDGNNYQVRAGKNKVLIFSFTKQDISGDLFIYEGKFRITKVIASNWEAKKIPLAVSRHWFDCLNLTDLDLSTASIPLNKMVSGYQVGRRIKKTKKVLRQLIKDRKR